MKKVLRLEENVDKYIKLADKKVEKDDLFGALSMLKSAEKIKFSADIFVVTVFP